LDQVKNYINKKVQVFKNKNKKKGSLTRPLINSECKYVIGIEKDKRFLPALEMLGQASDGIFHLVNGVKKKIY
jgi:hypothetical protein